VKATYVAVALVQLASMQVTAATEDPERACTIEGLRALISAPVHIESAVHVAGQQDVPAHCAVQGFIEHGTHIGFAVALPDEWNRKFLFLGIGGFAGVLEPLQRGIVRGYATATTDTGHQGASLEDATWALNNRAGVVNHYETGVELTAQALKGLTAAYYGAVPRQAYFEGCSAGGRQGLIEAQRYPSTFDGIVAAAPAWNYTKLLSSFLENGKQILKSPDNWVPPEAFAAIDRVVMQQCDASDGLVDGLILDPKRCMPDLRELTCKPGQRPPACLTTAQLGTIQKLVAPPFAKSGTGHFGFLLTGSEQTNGYSWGWAEWFFGTKPPMADASGKLNFARSVLPPNAERGYGPNQFVLGEQFFRYIVANDPAFDARSFRLDRDLPDLERKMGELLDADDTDLSRFIRTGGKLLVWHGWSDPAIPAEMAIDLYERIRRDTSARVGDESLDGSVRLFMVPGVQHCGGGTGLTAFDALGALEQWVEQGRAPERIDAAQLVDGKPAKTRPLCAYPREAHYRSGDPDEAASFDCK
jgi:Tannase and feruloyl esterase